jgi:hypothetical protein
MGNFIEGVDKCDHVVAIWSSPELDDVQIERASKFDDDWNALCNFFYLPFCPTCGEPIAWEKGKLRVLKKFRVHTKI